MQNSLRERLVSEIKYWKWKWKWLFFYFQILCFHIKCIRKAITGWKFRAEVQYFIALYLFNGFVVYFGGRLGTRSIQPNLPEISVQNSMDRFGPTGKVSKKRVHLLSGRFPFNKNSGLKFRKLHVLNGTVHSGCTDPTQATARFVIVDSPDN